MAVIDATFCSCEKKAWKKKITLVRDSNPWPLQCRCSTLTNWANKPTGSRSLNWFIINPWKDDDEVMNIWKSYTAIPRNAVGKSARDNPERHCGWFRVLFFSQKFERIGRKGHGNVFARKATKVGSTATVIRNSVDHIPYYLSGLSSALFLQQPFLK